MATDPSRQPQENRAPIRPQSNQVQFPSSHSGSENSLKTMGLLPEMHQSKGSTFSSIVIMTVALGVVVILGTQAKVIQKKMQVTRLEAPTLPPKPLPKPPKPLPPPPKIVTPKVEVPPVPTPEPPKVVVPTPQPTPQQPTPKPVEQPKPTPPAPKAVTPAPAPVHIAINKPQAASVANNDAHPAAIRLGSMSNPIHDTQSPAVSPVNLGRAGAPGMPASNSGMGPASHINLGGNGSPQGSMGGNANAAHPIHGLGNGVTGGTGTGASHAGAIQIAQGGSAAPIHMGQPTPPTAAKSAPKVLYKPRPEYTAEARQLHLEGVINVRIHVSATGVVQVLGIVGNGLGHGLNEAALRAAQGLRFSPAMQDGHPVEWDGTVGFNFQQAD